MKAKLKNELIQARAWQGRKTVVFMSDFGSSDGAVSAMHGVANAVSNELRLWTSPMRYPNSTSGKHRTA